MKWPFGRRDEVGRIEEDLAGSVVLRAGAGQRIRAEGVDWVVVFLSSLLLAFGALMVYSASIALADSPKYGTSYMFFFKRHLISAAIAVAAGALAYRVPLRMWYRVTPWLAVAAFLLLILVLIPGIGHSVNGARRWVGVGPLSIQVTEVVKLAALLGAAWFTVRRQEYMHSFTKGFAPMALVMALVAFLTNLQPDLGATVVIVCIALGVLFLGGLNLRIFLVCAVAVVLAVIMAVWMSPWRVGRVMAYLDPWSSEYALDKAYQLSHSLIAFGRGEWFGVGLGASVEKLNYLPEAHTDFILAVVGEELGFVGVFCVLTVYYFLVRRAFAIGRQAIKLERVYSGLIAEGVGLWIGVQVVINGGVATGLFPTKGLTLPLMSYGGSSLLATIIAIAILLRVDEENRILMRGGRV